MYYNWLYLNLEFGEIDGIQAEYSSDPMNGGQLLTAFKQQEVRESMSGRR